MCIFMLQPVSFVKLPEFQVHSCDRSPLTRSFGMTSHLIRSAIALLFPATLLAQGIPKAEYAERRDSLLAGVDSGIVIAFGAPDPVSIGRWSQLPAFRYLTGFLE